MYSSKDLATEIQQLIEVKRKQKSVIHRDWLTNEIMQNHSDISGEDSDFNLTFAKERVGDYVRKQIRRFKIRPTLEPDKQLTLVGFEYVQEYYALERENELLAVHVDSLSDEEIQSKVEELRAMGDGCHKHADELLRYLSHRRIRA